ncbi:MAG: Response regulator of zinc sigma-54-dependent two-component system [Labilithrix sp.]|nr:Response regulator of zinc sigma-54-dependent two-component system [Labilithrix sp.]
MSYSEPPPEETRLSPLVLTERVRHQPTVSWTDTAGNHTQIIDARVLVGSSAGSGLVLGNPTVSRIHAELEVREDGLWVRDLGSRNGTFVDGLQVTGARIPDKSRVRFGSLEVLVDYRTAQVHHVDLWPSNEFRKLVGRSVRMRELFATLARIAPMDASVLVYGETGTGKELVARAIHDASPRASKPFVVVDCAALPESLLDVELFGHAKGAFTGAVGARAGALESADGGTVFLDEIGELPITMQPKLLRVLESRTIRRVGESTHREVDVRFVSATHRDLLTMVNAGEFREDLYFRLSVIPVEVPALRDRVEDIELLVSHFLRASTGGGHVTPELMRQLTGRPWRGNVRELRNFVERARALGATEALAMTSQHPRVPAGPASGGPSSRAASSTPTPGTSAPVPARDDVSRAVRTPDEAVFKQAYKDFREVWIDSGEKEYVRQLLVRHDRNVSAAAREAEVDRTYIYRLIRKHDL